MGAGPVRQRDLLDRRPASGQHVEELVVGGATSGRLADVHQGFTGVAGERLSGEGMTIGWPAQEQRPVRVVPEDGYVARCNVCPGEGMEPARVR